MTLIRLNSSLREALRFAAFFLLFSTCMLGLPRLSKAQIAGGQRYAILIGGLGGNSEYTETFRQYLFESQKALIDQFAFPPSNVTVLAETDLQDLAFVTDVSTAENIQTYFVSLASKVSENDQVYVVLFGHGSFNGQNAQLNIPRRDLNDVDYARLVNALPAGRIVFINTASASAPFIENISAPERIVITATKSGTQRNETVFPRYFVEALADPAADIDKDGNLSVREVFAYTSQHTARSFTETSHLATEHAMLEDTGDGQAYREEELDEAGEGNLASITYLRRRPSAVATSGGRPAGTERQLLHRETLERAIAELKSQKSMLGTELYYAQLETLFIQLARLNDTLEGNTTIR